MGAFDFRSFRRGPTCRLLRVDADAVVGDDGRRGRIHFEFFGGKLQDGREGRGLWNAQSTERDDRTWSTRALFQKQACTGIKDDK